MLVFTSKSAKFLYESIILSYSNSLLLGTRHSVLGRVATGRVLGTRLLGQTATRCSPSLQYELDS